MACAIRSGEWDAASPRSEPKMEWKSCSTGLLAALSAGSTGREASAYDTALRGALLEPLLDELVRIVRFPVATALLPLWQLHLFLRQLLVGNLLEQMRDDVEATATLVIGPRHVPRGEAGIGRGKHLVARPGIVVPAVVGLEIHGRELPGLTAIVDPRFEPPCLFLFTHVEPVLDELDP